MRILLVHAHPVPSSFSSNLYRLALEKLTSAGHEVTTTDLYEEGFDPVMGRDERENYHDEDINRAPVNNHVERLLNAEALVLVYPVWNYGFPAILKGWFDRVFLPGVSFAMVDGKVKTNLGNISKLVVLTSYGGTRFRSFLAGDPPRKIVMRMLRATINPRATVRYLAHYDMNRSTEKSRRAFMDKAARLLETV